MQRTALAVGISVLALLGLAGQVRAACNLIPGQRIGFASVQGRANRPFAAPGEAVEVSTRKCDTGTGLTATASDHVVTVLYTPPTGAPTAVVLTAASDCSALASRMAACEASLGGAAFCVPGGEAGLGIVEREGIRALQFRFPDTDARCSGGGDDGTACRTDADCDGSCLPDDDDRTLTGPALIAVTGAADALPCGVTSCADASGTTACVDRFFLDTGACEASLQLASFPQFTALPPPNPYSRECVEQSPPCNDPVPAADEMHLAIDSNGNALLPITWDGVREVLDGEPVARLVQASIALPITLAGASFTKSFAPDGREIAPVFEPVPGAGTFLTLLGSADAPYTILRIARRSDTFQVCAGGDNDGLPCNLDTECPGGSCDPTTCVGGSSHGQTCANDSMCPSGECGDALFDLSALLSEGTTVVERNATIAGLCQDDPSIVCTPGSCPSGPCVTYKLEAGAPVPLDDLVARDELSDFTITERVDGQDRNGDGDQDDLVVTMRNAKTGALEPLGAPAGCGLTGTPVGRAAMRVSVPPVRLPAGTTEGDLLAFLESETGQNGCDLTGDGDVTDAVLRVFREGSPAIELTEGLDLGVDAYPLVNGRSLAISNGKVFYRASETQLASYLTERMVGDEGAEVFGPTGTFNPSLDDDGILAAWDSDAAIDGGDGNGLRDVYVDNLIWGPPERFSFAFGGGDANGASRNPTVMSVFFGHVAYESDATNLTSDPDNNGVTDVFATRMTNIGPTHRVSLANGSADEAVGGGSRNAHINNSEQVVFESDAVNLVATDTNGVTDVFMRRVAGSVTERLSVASGTGAEADGASYHPHLEVSTGVEVVFASQATNLVAGDTNTCPGFAMAGSCPDIYLHAITDSEPSLATTERISFGVGGIEPNGECDHPYISSNGFVVYDSLATNLVSGDTNGERDVFVRDRVLGITERVSVVTGGAQGNGPSTAKGISPNGRYVIFTSTATNLAPNDSNGAEDVFVHDRTTRSTVRVNLATNSVPTAGDVPYVGKAVVTNDASAWFASAAPDVVPGDTNGVSDIFSYGVDQSDPLGIDAEIFPTGSLQETVLRVFDTANPGPPISSCPVDQVEVVDGTAVFLRLETFDGTDDCPAGDLDGTNAAGERDQYVVHVWDGSGAPTNLGLAAKTMAVSSSVIAAHGELNDGEHADETGYRLAVHGFCTPGPSCAWKYPADGARPLLTTAVQSPRVAGNLVATTVVETPVDDTPTLGVTPRDLNGDGDTLDDDVLYVYDAAASKVTNVKSVATDFVVGERTTSAVCDVQLVAFRANEAAQGDGSLNGDADTDDEVLHVYDAVSGKTLNVGSAATACTFAACDPRVPYRITGTKVTFLTREQDQNGLDLNGDGDADDTVIRVYDYCGEVVTTLGPVRNETEVDPTVPVDENDCGVVVAPVGRCDVGVTCTGTADCPSGSYCDTDSCNVGLGTCARQTELACGTDADCQRCIMRVPAACVTDDDCPFDGTCEPHLVTASACTADGDGDGVPDGNDVCPDDANPAGYDGDGDGVGDVCDVAPFECAPAPRTDCKEPTALKATLVMKDKSPDSKDGMVWKWSAGEATTLAELGDPLVEQSWIMCLYDQTAPPSQPMLRASIPAGGVCAGKPCWKATGTKGFKYGDKELTPSGVMGMTQKIGVAGKAKLVLKAKGEPLEMPLLEEIGAPFHVQLQNPSGVCFSATYSNPLVQRSDLLKAKGGPGLQ